MRKQLMWNKYKGTWHTVEALIEYLLLLSSSTLPWRDGEMKGRAGKIFAISHYFPSSETLKDSPMLPFVIKDISHSLKAQYYTIA